MKASESFAKPVTKPGPLIRVVSATGLTVVVLVSITLSFYHRLWLPGMVLIKRDALRFFLPLKQHLVERLSAGELPQWFPYEALGRPFIGATHTGVFHPFTALYFFLPVPDAYRVSILLACLLAALGTFTLGRSLNLSRTGALLASIAFALSGYVVSITDNLVYLYSICLLPLFCLGIEKALRNRIAWSVMPAAIWATVFLNGDVQTGYYYAFIALLWIGLRAQDSLTNAGLRLVLIGMLAAMLAAIQLGPAWAVFVASDRAHPELFNRQAQGWTTHPLRLLTVLAAPVGENILSVATAGAAATDKPGIFVGMFWAESLYLGLPVTGLAILGMWCRRDLHVLAWLAGFALLLALGRWGVLNEIFNHVVPLWSAFRYPEKFMGIVSFAVAMLAGAGLDACRTGREQSWPWFATAAVCLSAGVVLLTETGVNAVAGFGASASLALPLTEAAARASFFSAVAALGTGVVLAGIRIGALRVKWLLAVLVALVVFDLARANFEAYHTGPAEITAFRPPLVQALAAREGVLEPGRFRLVTLVEGMVALPETLERAVGPYAAVIVARRQALVALHNAEFHLETAKRYLPGYKAEFVALLRQGLGLQAAARYNVKYYIELRSRLKNPALAETVVAELPDYDLALYRNPYSATPRAYLSSKPERAVSPVDPEALIARPDFLNGDVDVIETAEATLPSPAIGRAATIERYTPEEVQVRVEALQPAVLILLDAFEQGWRATLENGAAVPILRANALVRAVTVPAGVHVVTFHYETPFLRTGALASLAGVILCLLLLAPLSWRTRRHASLS